MDNNKTEIKDKMDNNEIEIKDKTDKDKLKEKIGYKPDGSWKENKNDWDIS